MDRVIIEDSKDMQELAKAIDKALEGIAGERLGFSLVVYTLDRLSYAGNTKREVSIEAIRKLLEYWESGAPDVPNHEVH